MGKLSAGYYTEVNVDKIDWNVKVEIKYLTWEIREYKLFVMCCDDDDVDIMTDKHRTKHTSRTTDLPTVRQ